MAYFNFHLSVSVCCSLQIVFLLECEGRPLHWDRGKPVFTPTTNLELRLINRARAGSQTYDLAGRRPTSHCTRGRQRFFFFLVLFSTHTAENDHGEDDGYSGCFDAAPARERKADIEILMNVPLQSLQLSTGSESVDPRRPRLAPHAVGESEVEVEVVQRIVLVRGAVARQAGHLTAQPEPLLQVQGTAGPVLLAAPGEAGVVDGHVGEAAEEGG